MCEVEGCLRPVDRDGVCFRHRMLSVGFSGLALFRHDRELGLTQAEKGREIIEAARKEGRDIMRVPGGRRPTEVYREGSWQSA